MTSRKSETGDHTESHELSMIQTGTSASSGAPDKRKSQANGAANSSDALPKDRKTAAQGADDDDEEDEEEAEDVLEELRDLELQDLFGEANSGYTQYLTRLSLIACLSGLQFGMDTGVASGMLVAIHDDLGHVLSSGEQELIVSATTVGAIFGSLVAGRLADWAGRKKVMIAAGVCFFLGSVEQAASQVVRELVLGRVIQGLAVGMSSMVIPTYLAEM